MVTDLVCVFPDTRDSARFADLFEQYGHGFFGSTPNQNFWRPEPVACNGSKHSGTTVYHMGINQVNFDLLKALEAQDWSPGTVLYYFHGDLDDTVPRIKVW